MAAAMDTPIVRDPQSVRDARRLTYLVILAQEAHVDASKYPADELIFAIASPYERAGYTTDDIEAWIAACDPVIKPPWDEITCFRAKVREALRPHPSLGAHLALVGGGAFLAAFLLTRHRR